jgi:hypothetical protein
MATKEEMKSIKIAGHTHARLMVLSSAFNKTISELIDDLIETAYPEIVAETDKVLNSYDSIRRKAEAKKQKKGD